MQNFAAKPTIMRSHELFDVVQSGRDAKIIAKSDRVQNSSWTPIFVVADIKAAKEHFAKAVVTDLEKAGAVAFVQARIDGKVAQIALTAQQYSAGAAERQRYADWDRGVSAWQAEQAAKASNFDNLYNEGGEGYNPHRG